MKVLMIASRKHILVAWIAAMLRKHQTATRTVH
jgi:hypothetical protein